VDPGKVLMSLKRLAVVGIITLAVSGLGTLFAQTQKSAQQTESLGDLARQLRAQRGKEKPVKVFTNDNLPARPATSSLTVAAEMSSTAEGETASGEKPEAASSSTSTESTSSEASGAHDEAYYRSTMGGLRSQLNMHQRQLSVLEQKLAQMQTQYFPDPNKTLQQESTPAFQSDLNTLRDDIAKKRQEIAADEKAIEDLRDQLRREGGPAGWLR
jgi:hypothetical protein